MQFRKAAAFYNSQLSQNQVQANLVVPPNMQAHVN